MSRHRIQTVGRLAPRALIPLLLAGAVVLAAVGPGDGRSAAAALSAKQTRPNIVVIEVDDQSVNEMPVLKKTLDLIGKQGTTFDTSFVTYSLCCPSRATFLTGQYNHNNRVLGNSPPNGGYQALDHSNTLAVWLQRAGYHTALIGKYLNGYGKPNATEVPPGWSEWYGGINLGFLGGTMNQNGTVVRFSMSESDYQTDVDARLAVDVIRRSAPKAQPFFMWVTPHVPHSGGPRDSDDPNGMATTRPAAKYRNAFAAMPLPAPPNLNEQDVSDKPAGIRNRAQLTAQQLNGIREAYQQQLESLLSVDDLVAQIVNQLRSSGELANTLIVYTDDNGFFHGEHRVPSGKVLVYEPSIRVPLLMRGPGVPKNRHLQQVVANVDLAPTIVAAAKAKAGRTMDGVSLWPLLKDPKRTLGRDLLIETGPAVGSGKRAGLNVFTAVRTARWKYVEYANGDRELYDLQADPYELSSRHADPALASVRADLARRLARLRTCAGASCR